MGFDAMLWLLALIAACSAGAYWAGWRAAASYLSTAVQYGEVVNALAKNANEYGASLDTTATALAELRGAIETSTETLARGDRATEAALIGLFEGLERAGTVRSTRRPAGRQVGEAKSEGD